MDLNGAKILITGAAVRLGQALALALADRGSDIILHYHQSHDEAQNTAVAISSRGVQCDLIRADLDHDPLAIFAQLRAKDLRCSALINSAAIFPDDDSLVNTDAQAWDRIMAINLRAPYLLSRAFAEQSQSGCIINVLDARTLRTGTDHFCYRLSKHGLLTLTQQLALALAPHIRVNGVALGAILPPPGQDKAYLDQLAATKVPLRHPGHPDEVCASVCHLLTSEFATGSVVRLDGGQYL